MKVKRAAGSWGAAYLPAGANGERAWHEGKLRVMCLACAMLELRGVARAVHQGKILAATSENRKIGIKRIGRVACGESQQVPWHHPRQSEPRDRPRAGKARVALRCTPAEGRGCPRAVRTQSEADGLHYLGDGLAERDSGPIAGFESQDFGVWRARGRGRGWWRGWRGHARIQFV